MRRMRIPCHGFTILYDFMLTCTDELFQRWRTGTHFVFHTLKRTPTNVGNLVCMDEYVGEHRVKFQAVVNHLVPNQEILWQLRKCGVLWPVWLRLQLTGTPAGVHIVHTLWSRISRGWQCSRWVAAGLLACKVRAANGSPCKC